MQSTSRNLDELLADVRACTICNGLPLGPRPLLQASADARILIVGQAPGSKTHIKGRPFDDASGMRLREWLGATEAQFYDPHLFAILPMGFCYPGTGTGGKPLLEAMPAIGLTLVLGQYALDWHVGDARSKTLTATVQRWREFWPELLPLPHPSPRNIRWFRANPWFEAEVIPVLRDRVQALI